VVTPDANDQRLISEYRQHGGGSVGGLPVLLLHTVGAKTGLDRVTPLVFWRVEDRRVAVLASNRGAPADPYWFRNLVANPATTVEIGTETWNVRAGVADADVRKQLLPRIAQTTASVAAALRRAPREIPLVILELLSRVES
jgi:deazaflavin-dependent oxidoreductase (nitroreductase family)